MPKFKFITDIFHTQICDEFEILENQMQSVAPSAEGNWEDALTHVHLYMCILGLGFFLKEFFSPQEHLALLF